MMTVHEINVRRENDAFVVSAEKRQPLQGMSVCTEGGTVTDWYRPEKVEMVFDKAEDAVTAVGRLLRDGA